MEKLDGLSMDIECEARARLAAVFPECFSEGELDIDKLLTMCGEYITNDFEKYKFEWHGKGDAMKLAQRRSAACLRPCKEESIDFDTTQNLYIEGDNLEVLKLLQTAYFRKVKMIYIDPPYNTGHDFVYEDDFKDPLARYLEVTSQATKSNPETMGRFHTAWLNMMYPRLRLAANLLRDDGVIFISIDETEQPNLRKICDEIYGEENHIADFVWHNKRGGGNDAKYVAVEHEYVIMYAKRISELHELFVPYSPEYMKRYKEEDENGKYFWDTFKRKSGKQYYPITCPDGTVLENDELGNPLSWLRSEARFKSDLDQGEARIISINGNWSVQFKQRLPDGKKPRTIFLEESIFEECGTTSQGSAEGLELFQKNIFSNPKPVGLLKHLLSFDTSTDDIILDFFSGSATTAHAVMQLNAEDGGNRQFICVQIPELTDEKSEAHKAGYKNICEIGKERIRRAGKKLREMRVESRVNQMSMENNSTLHSTNSTLDIGFKVFKLDSSNIKFWDGIPVGIGNGQTYLDNMRKVIDGIKDDRSALDVVYELMLKLGVPLTCEIAIREWNVESREWSWRTDNSTLNSQLSKLVYSVDGDLLLFCLEPNVTTELVEAMAEFAPAKMIFAEMGFVDDTAMANAHYILKDLGIEIKLV